MAMVRSFLRPALSLCLFALAGYGAYVPLEMVRSSGAAEAARPPAINAVSADVTSQPAEMSLSAEANPLVLEGERAIDHNVALGRDLTEAKL